MEWNPEIYNQFKSTRQEPFYDLISHLEPTSGDTIIDLGCGTGELTSILAHRFEGSKVTGIDSSAEMLAKTPKRDNLSFIMRTVEEQLLLADKWDVIIANASLQWVGNHFQLFPAMISKLRPGGQLAVQMPCQNDNVLNQILHELVHEAPYYEVLKESIHYSPVLTLDEYTQLLFGEGAKDIVMFQKVYPIIAESTETLYDFISGSALMPYIEKLSEPMKSDFISTYRDRIATRFSSSPVVYSFKRILMVANF